jgi:predicted glycosyltransferase involved in capsule biosynthesis
MVLGRFDFLYVFNYDEMFFDDALIRLSCSIKSIRNQNVKICVANYSQRCIFIQISKISPDIKYIHKPYSGPFSKALFINYAVKNMINSEYFILSDVDLVYSPDHIQRLKLKMAALIVGNQKFRYVTYNYNLAPVYKNTLFRIVGTFPFFRNFFDQNNLVKAHEYTHEYVVLDRMHKAGGGYAHGPGVIHTETFFEINGYDEDMIGHGPEDDMFNTRIGKVNRLVYDNLPDTATFHLWHPMLQRIQVEENMKIWIKRKLLLDNLVEATFDDVKANINKVNWGVL